MLREEVTLTKTDIRAENNNCNNCFWHSPAKNVGGVWWDHCKGNWNSTSRVAKRGPDSMFKQQVHHFSLLPLEVLCRLLERRVLPNVLNRGKADFTGTLNGVCLTISHILCWGGALCWFSKNMEWIEVPFNLFMVGVRIWSALQVEANFVSS